MARSFNQVILMGNLTRDPELRQTPNGQSVCSFSLALNRNYKAADGNWVEATDYIDIVAWGPLGDRIAQYLSKGRPCLVNGRLQSRSWEQEGVKRSKVEVNANDVTFLGGGGGDGGYGGSSDDDGADNAGGSAAASKPAPSKKPKKEDVAIEDIGDEPINLDDIPFLSSTDTHCSTFLAYIVGSADAVRTHRTYSTARLRASRFARTASLEMRCTH